MQTLLLLFCSLFATNLYRKMLQHSGSSCISKLGAWYDSAVRKTRDPSARAFSEIFSDVQEEDYECGCESFVEKRLDSNSRQGF